MEEAQAEVAEGVDAQAPMQAEETGDIVIDDEAKSGVEHGVNTQETGADDADIIGTYTQADTQEPGSAAGSRPGSGQAAAPTDAPGSAPGSRPGSGQAPAADAPAGSRPGSGQAAAPTDAPGSAPGSRPGSGQAPAADAPAGSRPGSGQAAAPTDAPGSAPGSRPGSGQAPAADAPAGSRPGSGQAAAPTDAPGSAPGSRPGSGQAPAADAPAGSRPGSGQAAAPTDAPGSAPGSRPGSGQAPAADAPAGSRPGSGQAAAPTDAPGSAPGSRPGSGQAPAADAPAGSRPGSGQAAAPTDAPGSAPGSRPGSGQAPAADAPAGSRPGSGQAPAADAPAGSRPGSGQAPAADAPAGSRPGSGQAPAADAPASSRPGSGQPVAVDAPVEATGSRPGSGQAAAPADTTSSGSRPASGQAPADASVGVGGSRPGSAYPVDDARPGTAQVGSRPASQPASAPPAAGSRPSSSAAHGSGPAGVAAAGTADAATEMTIPRPDSATGSVPRQDQGSRGTPSIATPLERPPSRQATAQPQDGILATTPPAGFQGMDELKQPDSAKSSDLVIPGMQGLDIEVSQGPGLPHRLVRVYMDTSQKEVKAYLGGYKNKRSGVTYHHAVTQTPKAPKYAGAEPKLERQTQTVKVKTRSGQTVREASTQMERPGLILDTTHDRVKTPGRYQTSEERLAIVTAATKTIQRYVRGWIGRNRAAALKAKKVEREAFLQDQEAKAQHAAEEHRKKEIERRMHPRTAADFEILYNELEAWRLQETRKIKEAGLPKDKEQEVMQQLLHKETKLLQTIDRLKINANHENKDLRIQRTLGDMSKPKQYELKNGRKVEVHTPFTTRAKELMQLYNGLNIPMLSIDERLDVLLHVKWTVKEFDCNLTREIVSLIDREADLLNRGRNPAMLEGLRKRISSMFLNFIETPEFNPEAARFQVVPMDFEQYLYAKLEKGTAAQNTIIVQTSKWDL